MKQQGSGKRASLVMVGIIAVLGAITVLQYNRYVTKTRVNEVVNSEAVVPETANSRDRRLWIKGTRDKTACWDQDYADGPGKGNGWVEGTHSYTWWRQNEAVSDAAGLSTVVHQILACTD